MEFGAGLGVAGTPVFGWSVIEAPVFMVLF